MLATHFTLQGKGGIGKSLVSFLFLQYLKSIKDNVVAIDADPINQTLQNFKNINAEFFPLVENDDFNTINFDKLIHTILSDTENDYFIDNGSSTFIQLSTYILETEILDLIKNNNRTTYIHMIITGGTSLLDNLNVFKFWASQKNVKIIVWLNEFFGKIEGEGKKFTEMSVYNESKANVAGIITLSTRNIHYAKNMKEMLDKKMTFDEAISSTEFDIVAKQRLTIIKRELFEQLNKIEF